jgi:transcription initiation factor TFIIIB Brf1 subunit/transcription initiation factor TFIIB
MAQKHGLVQKDRENTDWQNDIIPRIAELLEEYIEREGDKPTLRTMYYIALDEGLFPAVLASYKGLSSAIVTAKKAGRFREDAFTDNTRFMWTEFRTRDRYITQEAWVDDKIDDLKNADLYFKFPRWRNQPVHVIVVLEKATLFGVYKNILKALEVPIIVNRGNRGYQFLTDTLNELKEFYIKLQVRECEICDNHEIAKYCNRQTSSLVCQDCKIVLEERHKIQGLVPKWSEIERLEKVVLLYFGDCDPSGDNMSITLTKDIVSRGMDDYVSVKRVAVTFEQIVKYRLHFFPQDLNTMVKLLGDPNIEKFSQKLRTSPYYPAIKEQLDNDPEYASFKSQLIDHPNVVKRLMDKARRYSKDYDTLSAEELHKILNCDFLIFELDALVAKKHDLLKKIVEDTVGEYFDEDIYKQELEKHEGERILELVHKKIHFKDGDN